jgi:hypothetical protein
MRLICRVCIPVEVVDGFSQIREDLIALAECLYQGSGCRIDEVIVRVWRMIYRVVRRQHK